MFDPNKITYFGETDFRGARTKFGIKALDRTRHMYVIGKTGMGKSTILENMAIQDVQNGEGLAFMDPHGGSADKIIDFIPEDRIADVVYFAPFDTEFPVAFNVLEDVGVDKRHLVASGLMSSFKKIWVDAWSARMEYILNNILLALLEYPDATLLGVNRMLSDKDYRKKVVENITDPAVKSFWVDEFAKYSDKYMQEAGAAIQNKIGQFTTNPLIRNIVGQPRSSFDIRQIMDVGKILIVNLSKGRIGEQNSNLLGGMLITKIYLSAMSRADATPQVLQALPNFYLYVDEFQSFASDSFADILSEARKYKLNLIIAHQYIEQMSEAVRAAVFGNVGTMIVYRVGSFDAQIFEREFLPAFNAEDIVNLGKYQMYLRLMINGVGSKPFSALGMPPIKESHRSFKKEIIESSRKQFSTPRAQVEEAIRAWHLEGKNEKKEERFKKENENNFEKSNRHFEKSFKTIKYEDVDNGFKREDKIIKPIENTEDKFQIRKQNNFNSKPSINQTKINKIYPEIKTKTFSEEKKQVNKKEFIMSDKSKLSSSLKNILTILEKDNKDNISLNQLSENQTQPQIQTLDNQSNINKEVSSGFVKPKTQPRAATPESSALLKDVLNKVLKDKKQVYNNEDKSSIIKQSEDKEKEFVNISQNNISQKLSNQNSGYKIPEPEKDVPEDILRNLLKTNEEDL